VVISYCEEEEISQFTRHLDVKSENIKIIDVTIISECSESKPIVIPHNMLYTYNSTATKSSERTQPELNFIRWLIKYLEYAKLNSLPQHFSKNNHVTIFLNSRSIKSEQMARSLDDTVQSAMENRFGCLLRPPNLMSYYHDSNALRSFVSGELHPSQIRYYKNLGEWIDNLDASKIFDGLVPVCYGSSFIIRSIDLSQRPEEFDGFLQAMLSDYKKHEYRELVEFVKRSFAALFSHRLSEENALKLRKYATEITTGGASYSGALIHRRAAHPWHRFFRGDTLEIREIDYSKIRLTLVISHCNENMSWMNEYFNGLDMQDVTIISKCNEEVTGNPFAGAEIVRLPNVGRCDHSHATWMLNMKEEDAAGNHIVLFIKASRLLYQLNMAYIPVRDVIRIALGHGFACESVPTGRKSHYYRTEFLKTVAIEVHRGVHVASQYPNMEAWLDDMEITLPSPFTPVCFGGNFAAKASQIFPRKYLWQKMVENLGRGDSIEEGHFVERAWAGILSYPLNSNETAVLNSMPVVDGRRDGEWLSLQATCA